MSKPDLTWDARVPTGVPWLEHQLTFHDAVVRSVAMFEQRYGVMATDCLIGVQVAPLFERQADFARSPATITTILGGLIVGRVLGMQLIVSQAVPEDRWVVCGGTGTQETFQALAGRVVGLSQEPA